MTGSTWGLPTGSSTSLPPGRPTRPHHPPARSRQTTVLAGPGRVGAWVPVCGRLAWLPPWPKRQAFGQPDRFQPPGWIAWGAGTSRPKLCKWHLVRIDTRPLRRPGGARLDRREQRAFVLWAADCAEHVLPAFERQYPHDARPRRALAAERAWAHGEVALADARAAAFAAHAAARAVTTRPPVPPPERPVALPQPPTLPATRVTLPPTLSPQPATPSTPRASPSPGNGSGNLEAGQRIFCQWSRPPEGKPGRPRIGGTGRGQSRPLVLLQESSQLGVFDSQSAEAPAVIRDVPSQPQLGQALDGGGPTDQVVSDDGSADQVGPSPRLGHPSSRATIARRKVGRWTSSRRQATRRASMCHEPSQGRCVAGGVLLAASALIAAGCGALPDGVVRGRATPCSGPGHSRSHRPRSWSGWSTTVRPSGRSASAQPGVSQSAWPPACTRSKPPGTPRPGSRSGRGVR